MTDRSHASSSRDFAFQNRDQHLAQQTYGHYDAERDPTASGANENPLQAHVQDPSLRYQAFGVQHPQPQFPGYGFSPSAPMGWDWTNSIDFSEFTNQFEPQGELLQEHQHPATTNDFSIPLPIAIDTVYQAPQPSQGTTPLISNAQNPLSPPPKPPSRPVVQTSLKRKAESEPGSAISQNTAGGTESQQNQSKRQNKSRQSSATSATSATSPVVTESADIHQSPPAHTAAAQADPEPTTQNSTELAKKKDQSKGTGPQGRVIDVSRPRKVQEATGGPDMLPAGKVFPIQIGSELFRLSGASLSSDGKHRYATKLARTFKLRPLEPHHTFRISSANSYTIMAVALAT